MDEHARDPRGYFVYRRVDQGENGGQFVSKSYWERNPDTTAREWIEVKEGDTEQDPDVLAVLHAIDGAKQAEDYDVAEFILDANEALSRVYKNIMRAKER